MPFTTSRSAYISIPIWVFRRFIPALTLLALLHAIFLPLQSWAQTRQHEWRADTGNSIKSATPVKSVVALYGAFNEILMALGCQDLIKARTDADASIPELAHLPSVGTHMRPNLELIAAAKPDVVLQMRGRNEAMQDTEALQKLGIQTLVFELDSFEKLFAATKKLGELTGTAQKADALVESWQKRLADLEERRPDKSRPKVFYEARYPNLLAAGKTGIVNDIIEAAGGENVINVPKKLVRISEEALLAQDPEVYIIQKGPMNPAPAPLEERQFSRGLKALRGNFVVDERKFARPGPHSVDAAEELAQMLFPGNTK